MSAAIAFYDVRYRADGSEEDWTQVRFPVDADIIIPDVVRGADYLLQIRSVSSAGRTSEWVDAPVSVPDTNREGAAALPVNATANIPSVWDVDTEVTFTATTDGSGDSLATIDVSAGTLVMGGRTVTYSASSGTITGTPGQTKRVYLYYDDPRLMGGARTLGVTDNYITSVSGNGRVAIIGINVTFPNIGDPPSTGGGNIGGGGGGGGGNSPGQDPL